MVKKADKFVSTLEETSRGRVVTKGGREAQARVQAGMRKAGSINAKKSAPAGQKQKQKGNRK